MKDMLVGDIGGTNARFALWRDNQLHEVKVFATADYTSPEQAIEAYLQSQGITRGGLAAVCLAVAGPVDGDEFRFTNNHWRLSRAAFCKTLQVERLLLINDFTAMALGMTRLREGEFREVCPGQADPSRPALVIGPGTGLGVGSLLRLGEQHWQALPGRVGMSICRLAMPVKRRSISKSMGRSAMSALKPYSVVAAWCACIRQSARWTATHPGTQPPRRSPMPRWAVNRRRWRWSSNFAGSLGVWPVTMC